MMEIREADGLVHREGRSVGVDGSRPPQDGSAHGEVGADDASDQILARFWANSGEKQWCTALIRILLALGLVSFALAATFVALRITGASSIRSGSLDLAAIALFAVGSLSAILVPSVTPLTQGLFIQRKREKLARDAADRAADDLSDSSDLTALVKANARQMQAYDVLARGQARSSYRMAQLSMAVGLLVVVGGAIGAIAAGNQTAKITTASLTALGGVLSGYISKTFLRTYEQTIKQLNFYFEQPLINSYILVSERLVNGMSRARRDELFSRIVTHVLAVLVRGARPPGEGAEADGGTNRAAEPPRKRVRARTTPPRPARPGRLTPSR